MEFRGGEDLVHVPVGAPDTRSDDRSLDELEEVIRRGLKTFMEVGKALAAIRERRLYKDRGYATFEGYCRKEHGLGRSYVNKQIRAAEVVEELGTVVPNPASPKGVRPAAEVVETLPVGNKLPQSERVARPLTRIQDSEGRAEAWRQAQDEAEALGEPVTAKRVEEKVREHLTSSAPEPTIGDLVDDDFTPPPRELSAEQHVGAVESYPELKPFSQTDARKMARNLDAMPEPEREEKREMVKRNDPDTLADLTNRPRLPEGPTVKQMADNDPGYRWSKAVQEVQSLVAGVRDAGGIVALVNGWRPESRRYYLEEVRRLKLALSSWEEILEAEVDDE